MTLSLEAVIPDCLPTAETKTVFLENSFFRDSLVFTLVVPYAIFDTEDFFQKKIVLLDLLKTLTKISL